MFKHIFVPTDGSQLSCDSAQRAIAFAREAGARISFFFAKPDYPAALVTFPGDGTLIETNKLAGLAEQQAKAILAKHEAAAKAAGVTSVSITSDSDAPYEAIIAAAEQSGADLIFMASHGRRGIRGLLLGSETQKVLTHSKIPVLVYR